MRPQESFHKPNNVSLCVQVTEDWEGNGEHRSSNSKTNRPVCVSRRKPNRTRRREEECDARDLTEYHEPLRRCRQPKLKPIL
ncbi:MAG: hypothetical protein AAF085_14925, partial [Planctomycetota bacterium]